jgi:hypothetical protein
MYVRSDPGTPYQWDKGTAMALGRALLEVLLHREATVLCGAIHHRDLVALAALAEGGQRELVRTGARRALASLAMECADRG